MLKGKTLLSSKFFPANPSNFAKRQTVVYCSCCNCFVYEKTLRLSFTSEMFSFPSQHFFDSERISNH